MSRTLHQMLTARWRNVLVLGLLALAPVASAAKDQGNADAQAAYDKARDFIQKRDWRSARVELMNATAADPQWAAAHLELAGVALELFDPVTAKAQIQKAKASGALEQDYAHLLGHAYWLSGELDQAHTTLTRSPVARAKLPYAYRILGRVQMDRGDTVAAGQAFDRGLAIAPKDSRLWTEIGRLRYVIANMAGSAEALDRAVALDPANVRALELRGRLVRAQFGLLAALPWFERALQVDPNDIPVLEEYGATLGDVGRNRDMLAQARKILSLDTGNSRAFYMQASIAARAGNYALARRLMDKVGGRFGELPAPQLLTAISDYELGNYNQSVDVLARLVEAQPQNQSLRALLARATYKSGDMAGAWDVIAPIVDRADADNYTITLGARILEGLGERGPAAGRLQRTVFPALRSPLPLAERQSLIAAADDAARNPKNARKVIPFIRLLITDGQFDRARSEAARLTEGNAGVVEAQILSGDVELAAGNQAAAVAAYERARAVGFSTPVLVRLVAAYRANGNAAAASKSIADYLGYNPTSLTAQRMMAFDLIDRKLWGDALPWLYRVRARSGLNDVVLNANIARTLSALDQNEEATREARLAYRIDPANAMATQVYGQILLKSGEFPKKAYDLLRKASKLEPDNKIVAKELVLASRQLEAKAAAK